MADLPAGVASVAVDLSNCDREPIHLLGAVQSFGFLVAVDASDWSIRRISRNAAQYMAVDAAALLGKPLDQFFTADAIHTIRGHLQTAVFTDTVARAFAVPLLPGATRYDIAVHMVDDLVVIECEPCHDRHVGINSGALVRTMIARLQQTPDLRMFYRVAAREMRALTGFDRVMIYRFDHDGSGEVIAESAGSGLESYLGLHYPASDIPKQARVLYERNWLRIIPDIDAPTAPIEPAMEGGRPIDLSMSVLRSVSPIHIEYLRNMGVRASMSVSILRDGRLWGLFACHHYGAHNVPFEKRTAAELFGQMFSLMLESRERESEASYESRARKLHNQLVTVMASEATRFDSIVNHLDEIADLLSCDGIGVWTADKGTLHGQAPTREQFAGLIAHLGARELGDIHASHEIAAEYPEGKAFAERAAGMLVVPLSRPARDFLVFFRKEVARTVNWAGDPNKPIAVGPLGARLTPRKSFELWRETVSGQSIPWQPVDVRIAESLRVSLLEVILRLSDITEVERRRAQERQELLIAELNHRVRNILGLIRGVISQSRDSALSAEGFMDVVGGRIQALARAHDQITADQWGPASFRGLVIAEAGAYLGGKANRVRLGGPEVLLEPQGFTTLALVIHELMTNSAKYGALSDSRGSVEIETAIDLYGRLRVTWSEFGGPPVKQPTRRGFGSTVIERSIPYDLKGDAAVTYDPAGLRATFVIPALYARMPASAEARPVPPAPRETPSMPLPNDVLVVEDNMIIALDAESALKRAGIGTVRVAGSVEHALRLIAEKAPEFALLDINLGQETSFAIAEHLAEIGVRFAFTTGYGEDIAFPPKMLGVTRIRKPYTAESLVAAMRG